MKTPFKVGERVAVYGHGASLMHPRHVGVVRGFRNQGGTRWIQVDLDNADPKFHDFHPKQCRRLKPKAKRRDFWIIPTTPNIGTAYSKPCEGFESIHVREVRKVKS